MTSDPATCRGDSSLRDVARTMRDRDIGAVPVVENGKPIGIVTDRDITVRAVAEGKNPAERTASEIMTTSPVTVRPSDDAETLLRTMQTEKVRRAVVVGDNGECVGMVAQADIARRMSDDSTGELVEELSEKTRGASRPAGG